MPHLDLPADLPASRTSVKSLPHLAGGVVVRETAFAAGFAADVGYFGCDCGKLNDMTAMRNGERTPNEAGQSALSEAGQSGAKKKLVGLAGRRAGKAAAACLAVAVMAIAGCASGDSPEPPQPSSPPLPTAPPDDLDTPPAPPPIGELLPGLTDEQLPPGPPDISELLPDLEPVPTAAPFPTVEPVPTAGPVPAFEPVPTAAPFPTFDDASAASVELLTPAVVAVYPHDPEAFTQGLLFEDGRMYESTGLYEASTLREVDYRTGRVLRQIVLAETEVGRDMRFFAEGLALVDEGEGSSHLVQLTWEDQMAFAWDTETFHETAEPVEQYRYKGEGWGLCYDGDRLTMSNGTSVLNFHSPEGFAMGGESLTVMLEGNPVERLNELECVGDDIWANVWLTDQIMRIDARTGQVTGVVDASPLTASLGAGCGNRADSQISAADATAPASAVVAAIQDAGLPLPCVTDPNAVLNGIAHDETTGRFFLTGKNWPLLFEVRF